MNAPIRFNIYHSLDDKVYYPHRVKLEEEMEKTMTNIEDNIYVIKDDSWYNHKEETIIMNWNKFYYAYSGYEREHTRVDHFWEYEYKIDWEKLQIRWLYVRDDYESTLQDWWSGNKIMYKVDWWWDVWEFWSSWWHDEEKNSFKKEETDWWWIEWPDKYSSRAKDIVLNYIKGNKDLISKYKEMLIPRAQVERIAKEYLWDIDWVELHFSQLYKSKSMDYLFYLFHRKDVFKFNSDYVVIVTENEQSNNPIQYVLKFKSDELKKLFDKKKKKDWEESDFIRIRFKMGNVVLFETGDGELIDITEYLVKK